MAERANPVQSIDRVFDIIELLSSYPRGLLLSDIALPVNLPKSTVHRLLLSLIERGYVVKEPDMGRYQLTIRMFEVGSRAIDVLNIMTIARPYYEHLADITQEIIHLVKRDGEDVVYLAKIDASSATVRTSSTIGMRSKMYYTGVGKAILANLPTDEARRIWDSSDIQRFTPNTITTWDVLAAEMEKIRTLGYATDNEEHEPGVRCVAAPIFDCYSRPAYAMSISAPITRMSDADILRYAPMLVSTAREISHYLGYSSKSL
ncbi:MAG: IclR family transcriptional regulator [Eubacteriales bacterium]|nr:IclR family transcriptional regulator [Eubacteriales bacterium]